MSIQSDIHIPKAALLTNVTEHHTSQLVPTPEMLCPVIALVLFHDPKKFSSGKQTQELGENERIFGHGEPPASRVEPAGEYTHHAVRLKLTDFGVDFPRKWLNSGIFPRPEFLIRSASLSAIRLLDQWVAQISKKLTGQQ
jgi:hypothetical protein